MQKICHAKLEIGWYNLESLYKVLGNFFVLQLFTSKDFSEFALQNKLESTIFIVDCRLHKSC